MKYYGLQFTLLLLVCFFSFQNKLCAQEDFILKSGDVLQIVLPVAAFSTTIIKHDKEGFKQMAYGFGANFILTHGIKRIVNKERPNGGNHAFPSGHTAAAFQGAVFLYKRYGKKYGIPAIALATYVGYSRTQGELPKHDIWDVMGGAALGTITSLLITKSIQENIELTPVITQNSFILGARITI